jgi:hypothetical protein
MTARPASVYKPGRDVTVGDVLPQGPGGFLILGFARFDAGDRKTASRMALNCWAEGIVVFDDRPTAVLGRTTERAT